jgi:hypothetical protein
VGVRVPNVRKEKGVRACERTMSTTRAGVDGGLERAVLCALEYLDRVQQTEGVRRSAKTA